MKALVIGDTHFDKSNLSECKEFSKRIVSIVEKVTPDFVVMLGDTLDKHANTHVDPFNLACNLIESISKVSPLYLLIGNHDYINHNQFLTNEHFFNPLKKWYNVTVVDKPVYKEIGDKSFVFMPYVPMGRFLEGLEELTKQGELWEMADCIFAHQEFRGCKLSGLHDENIQIISEFGDVWQPDYPPIISGHIHDQQKIGTNVYYPGSALQTNYTDIDVPEKKVWLVDFKDDLDEGTHFNIKKVNLRMKSKKLIHLPYEKLKDFDKDYGSKVDQFLLKLDIVGSGEQIRSFRKSKQYRDLNRKGIKFTYSLTNHLQDNEALQGKQKNEISFLHMFKEVVEKKKLPVQKEYEDVMGVAINQNIESTKVEVVFEGSDEEVLSEGGDEEVLSEGSDEEVLSDEEGDESLPSEMDDDELSQEL